MRNAEVLILDDLGTQRSSPWADEKLFQLINHRYMHRLPTVVTMNERAWPSLEERIGVAVGGSEAGNNGDDEGGQ